MLQRRRGASPAANQDGGLIRTLILGRTAENIVHPTEAHMVAAQGSAYSRRSGKKERETLPSRRRNLFETEGNQGNEEGKESSIEQRKWGEAGNRSSGALLRCLCYLLFKARLLPVNGRVCRVIEKRGRRGKWKTRSRRLSAKPLESFPFPLSHFSSIHPSPCRLDTSCLKSFVYLQRGLCPHLFKTTYA